MIRFSQRRRPRQYKLNRRSSTARGLLGWWPGRFPGRLSLHDLSGYGNDGTWAGTGTHWTASERGTVGQFNGSDDCINVGALSPSRFTISAWVNPTDFATHRVIASKIYNVVDHQWKNFEFRCSQTTGILRGVIPNGGTWNAFNSAVAIIASVWTYVVLTYDGTTGKIFINGVQDANTLNQPSYQQVAADEVFLGARADGGSGPSWFFKGLMDDVRIYDRALSAAEIRYIYDCGRRAPLSDLVVRRNPLIFFLGGEVSSSSSSSVSSQSSSSTSSLTSSSSSSSLTSSVSTGVLDHPDGAVVTDVGPSSVVVSDTGPSSKSISWPV